MSIEPLLPIVPLLKLLVSLAVLKFVTNFAVFLLFLALSNIWFFWNLWHILNLCTVDTFENFDFQKGSIWVLKPTIIDWFTAVDSKGASAYVHAQSYVMWKNLLQASKLLGANKFDHISYKLWSISYPLVDVIPHILPPSPSFLLHRRKTRMSEDKLFLIFIFRVC